MARFQHTYYFARKRVSSGVASLRLCLEKCSNVSCVSFPLGGTTVSWIEAKQKNFCFRMADQAPTWFASAPYTSTKATSHVVARLVIVWRQKTLLVTLSPSSITMAKFLTLSAWGEGRGREGSSLHQRQPCAFPLHRIRSYYGTYLIGGTSFESLQSLVGYYTNKGFILSGERLQHPVAPAGEPIEVKERLVAVLPYNKNPDSDELR